MHYPDLSPYRYLGAEPGTLNVGWLDSAHPYPTGDVPAGFAECLLAFLETPVRFTLGFHTCEICQGEHGLHEIRVFGQGQVIYAAPTMIHHYVADHHYLPPEEFIRAVLDGPLPDSKEYRSRAKVCAWGADIEM